MPIIETIELHRDFGGTETLSAVSIAVEAGEKVGLVGRNGCGKTTLLRILAGEDDDYRGSVRREPGRRVAYVPQRPPAFRPGETASAFICRDALDARAELESLAEAMGARDEAQARAAMSRYAVLRGAYDEAAGDEAEAAAERLLAKAGLGHRADVSAEALSGGEKNVLALARAVRQMPDLLMLDEPGNHLDATGLAWLEGFLRSLPCAVLVVSHDRRLLDRTVDAVIELEGGRATRYAGNYSAYRLARLKEAAGQGQQWQADRKRVERLEALVRRFADIARSRPDPAWGKRLRARRSQLERVRAEAAERPDLGRRDAAVSFLGEASKADLALRVEGYVKAYGETVILESSGFTVMNGERVALLGPNGSGKTSLLRDIVSRGSWDDAVLRVGPSMVVGYCAQAQEVFDPGRTVEEEFLRILPTRREAFAHLSRFLFSYEDLDKRVSALSGGELNRLQLARASALKANFLILDEPTNHLDIPTREAVEDALSDFEGAVLVVSHDRYFLDKVAERVVFIDERRLVEYEGGFSEYWRDVASPSLAARARMGDLESRGRSAKLGSAKLGGAKLGGAKLGGAGDDAAGGSRDENALEARIEALEREKGRLERLSAEAFDAKDYRRAKALAEDLAALSARLERLWARFAG